MDVPSKIRGQIFSTINVDAITETTGGKQKSDKIATPRTTFKGECLELEGAYLDFYTDYRADMYENSIHLISGYVARH